MSELRLQCPSCKHYEGRKTLGSKERCKAFPRGIPEKVFDGRIVHDDKLTGQVGKYLYLKK